MGEIPFHPVRYSTLGRIVLNPGASKTADRALSRGNHVNGPTGYDYIRPVTYPTCHADGISTSGRNGTNSEATMTTRKPKPTLESMIELPTEQLQLATVTVEQKAPARGGQTRHATELTMPPSSLRRGKITLH
jgi:hypothetical protein